MSKLLKTIIIAASAQDHHIAVKRKSVLKWLKTGHEVRVQIQGKADRHKGVEEIFRQMEKEAKSGADVKQKVVKPGSIKFNLKPTSEAANLVIPNLAQGEAHDIEDIASGKDILSEDFEKELLQSIEEEKSIRRKK